MLYHLVIETNDAEGQVSIPSDVADAITKAAKLVDGVQTAQVIQMGQELQTPTEP